MTLDLIIATWKWPGWEECVKSWDAQAAGDFEYEIIAQMDIMPAFQAGFLESKADIQGYVHDDVIVHEQAWDYRVKCEFNDQQVGVVGFGGAMRHGSPHIYKAPYDLSHVGRMFFASNMLNAESHGGRFTGECDCAVLDGFTMFVRRELLEKAGGWPLGTPIGYFMYAEWLCCMARRMGYRIRLLGVSCEHLGGRSTGMNPNLRCNAQEQHRYIYDNFSDVLPFSVEGY